MTDPSPLVCAVASFVSDPVLADTVDQGYDRADIHSPTTGPNRYTIHVPTEVTRLSLGKESPRDKWNTDVGITGYTNSHVHFEVKKQDQTVVSLGGPATTALIQDGDAPKSSHGYSMVTEGAAWHDAVKQHYFLSQGADISLSTHGADKRAVIQSDHGIVDLNGGLQVTASGGGVSIAAGELELEDVRYGGHWEGKRPHSAAAGAGRITVAILAATATLHDLLANKIRAKFDEGKFTPVPVPWTDRGKWVITSALLGLALNKVRKLVSAEDAPPKCVKIDAKEKVGIMAGGNVGFFGKMGASLGSAAYATVSAGFSAGLSGMAFAGVGGSLVSVKGFRKVDIGSDWGKSFVGAEKKIEANAEKKFLASAKKTAHVASCGRNAKTLLGSGKRTWVGTGQGWGMLLDGSGVAMGKATDAKDMAGTKISPFPAIRVDGSKIELHGADKTRMNLTSGNCTLVSPKISFDAASGPVTVNGSKILLK